MPKTEQILLTPDLLDQIREALIQAKHNAPFIIVVDGIEIILRSTDGFKIATIKI